MTPPPEACDADLIVLADAIAGVPGAAMLVRDGRVAFVGPVDPACAAKARETLDRRGEVVLPGFVDMHAHPAEGGAELRMLDLSAVASVDALAEAVRAWGAAHPRDPWIEGAGFDAVALDGVRPLAALDAASPDRPVYLGSADGHSAFVNTRAMRAAHLATTADGVDRGPDGPTGWVREAASEQVAAAIPAWSAARTDAATLAGVAEFLRYGVTTIVDANASRDTLASYARLDRRGQLHARIDAAVEVTPGQGAAGVARVARLRARFHTPHLAVTAVKVYLDGVVESETASLLAPYADGTDARLLFDDADLATVAAAADRAGLQLHAHAIGDAAVRQLLDAVATLGHTPSRPPLAAHLELIDPADVPRFAALGVVADVQALWAYPDPYVAKLTAPIVGPERLARLYPFGDLARAGATIVGGSDWSVTTANPWPAIEVALTRRDPDTPGDALGPDEALDFATMLAAYTTRAGEALGIDAGRLVPGSPADFVVIDADPFMVPVEALSEVKVRETWVGGVRVW